MSESLSDGTLDTQHGRKFFCTKPQKCHYAVTEGRWFTKLVLFWEKFVNNIVQLQKKMPHVYFVLVHWITTNRNKKKKQKASHRTSNFVDEVGHFDVPL